MKREVFLGRPMVVLCCNAVRYAIPPVSVRFENHVGGVYNFDELLVLRWCLSYDRILIFDKVTDNVL